MTIFLKILCVPLCLLCATLWNSSYKNYTKGHKEPQSFTKVRILVAHEGTPGILSFSLQDHVQKNGISCISYFS